MQDKRTSDVGELLQVDSSNTWTGETACALQAALRLGNEAFAEHLGIGVRTVNGWHQKPTTRPQWQMQQILDTALEQAPAAARKRFAERTAAPPAATETATDAEERLTTDPNVNGTELGQQLFSNSAWGTEVIMPNGDDLATSASAAADAENIDLVVTVLDGEQFYQIGTWEGGWSQQFQVP